MEPLSFQLPNLCALDQMQLGQNSMQTAAKRGLDLSWGSSELPQHCEGMLTVHRPDCNR